MTPRVTVVIPCYKGGALLERAVGSVLQQTEPDFELLIVDDGSPDDTGAIAEALAAKDSRIRVIRLPENKGKPSAMNHAMAEARGAWIAVLDHDDWYAPSRLERLIGAAEAAGADMAADRYGEVDIRAGVHRPSRLPKLGGAMLDLDHYLATSDPTAPADFGMLKPVVRTDFLKRHGIGYYPPAFVGEDFYFLLDYFSAGGKAILVEEALYFYVQPFGSVSRQWAEARRKPYDYDLYLRVHDHYAVKLAGCLTAGQARHLARRRRGIRAMIAFNQVRDAVKAVRPVRLLQALTQAPPEFWTMMVKRIEKRLSNTRDFTG